MSHRILALIATLLLAGVAEAGLEIRDAWSPEAPPGHMMAGYLELVNTADADIALVDAFSPQFERVEIHTMTMDDGVMRMRRLDQLPVPAGDTVILQPGGLHLMLITPHQNLAVGDMIEVELVDAEGNHIPVTLEVRSRRR